MAVVLGIVKTHWSGTSGGPGITQLAFQAQTDPHTWDESAAQIAVDSVRSFWAGIVAQLPNNVSLTVDPVVDIFNIIDAGLVGSQAANIPPAVVTGTDGSAFNMAAGIKVSMKTGSVLNRRRVHGGLYVVPSAGGAFDFDGVVTSTAQTAILNSINTLRTFMLTSNAGLCVWSRPKKAKGIKPAVPGAASDVTGFVINPHGGMLRGRRD